MHTPNPRGFAPQSFTATVCERFEDSFKGKRPPAQPIDLESLFPLPPRRHAPPAPPPPTRTPRMSVALSYEEKKLMLPTGNKVLRKKGKHAGKLVDEQVRILLVTVLATVSDGKREFFFRVTSGRSTTVFDSRSKTRRPISEVKRELVRLCGGRLATRRAFRELRSHLAVPKPETVDIREFSAPEPNARRARLQGHVEHNEQPAHVPAREFLAYLNHNLPPNWESLPDVRPDRYANL